VAGKKILEVPAFTNLSLCVFIVAQYEFHVIYVQQTLIGGKNPDRKTIHQTDQGKAHVISQKTRTPKKSHPGTERAAGELSRTKNEMQSPD